MAKRGWLYLGIGTEVFHIVFIVAVLFCGKLWLPAGWVNLAITLTIMGQIIFLWCPLSVLSNYCFRRHDPDLKFSPSITLWLYGKYGRLVGIPIFLLLLAVSTLVGLARFS